MKQAQEKGYRTYLYFVCIDDPTVNVQRVEDRVKKGGHKVDITKIISRYPDTLKNLYHAIKYSNRAYYPAIAFLRSAGSQQQNNVAGIFS
jgi:predicted ABC-type ATPase